MAQQLSLAVDPALVRPLAQAANEFLQVLLSTFRVEAAPAGLTLHVDFDFNTASVWLRRGRTHIRRQLDDAKKNSYTTALRALLGEPSPIDYVHDDPAFPFRFGNGGTLPVVRIDNDDFYCLFYRETHPIGWNIANGGAESVAELIDPLATIERELREELIIIDPAARRRYVFDWNEGRRPDHPDFTIARRIWREIFRQRDFGDLEEIALPLKWLGGSDAVAISFDGGPPVVTRDCLLNINAEDFGIEVDRVAKLSVGPGAVLCDGEVIRGALLNRVVGLFNVRRLNGRLAAGHGELRPAGREFLPDRVFWNAAERPASRVESVVDDHREDLKRRGIWAPEVFHEWEAADRRFDLCPATKTLIRRTLLRESAVPTPEPADVPTDGRFEVFLCFASEARDLAVQVFESLQSRGRRVFFSDQTLHNTNFHDAIDDALASASALVVVGTEREHFQKRRVKYEWQAFHNAIMEGLKPDRAPMVVVTTTLSPRNLPLALATRQVLTCTAGILDARTSGTLDRLLRLQ